MSISKKSQQIKQLRALANKDLDADSTHLKDTILLLGALLRNTNSTKEEIEAKRQIAFGFWLAYIATLEKNMNEINSNGKFFAKDKSDFWRNYKKYETQMKKTESILNRMAKFAFNKPIEFDRRVKPEKSRIVEAFETLNSDIYQWVAEYKFTTPAEWINIFYGQIESPEDSPDFTTELTF